MLSFSLVLLVALTTGSCQKTGFLTKYGIFHVEDNGTTVTMNGTIGGRTEKHWDNLVKDHPNVDRLVMGNCPGSKNDDANLRVSKKIYYQGMHIHLNSDSEIASGAVDMFLAGTARTIDSGARVGVHSWGGIGKNGNELPEDDPERDKYINYYVSVGMAEQDARDFYFFTLNAAPANDMHWMTEAELEQYNMATQ